MLWCGLDPWPGNVHRLWVWPKEEKKIDGKIYSQRQIDVLEMKKVVRCSFVL